MSSLNKVQLIGNLGKDPELRTTSGDDVCNFSIATSERWKDRDGEQQEKTEWHNIVVWGKLAEVCDRYLSKGSKVYVSGKLQTRKWTDKDGNDRYTTEVVLSGFGAEMIMLDGKRDDDDRGGRRSSPRDTERRDDRRSRSNGRDDRRNDRDDRRHVRRDGGAKPPQSAERDNFNDLDDDIPF